MVSALASLAAVCGTRHAQPAEAKARSQSLADVWALKVTPAFVGSVGPRFVDRARNRGVNQRRRKRVFNVNYETGNISQWSWGAQCANTSSTPLFTRGTIAVQSEIVAQGRYAARINLPASPREPSACEAVRKRTLDLSDEWYALEFRLPLDWREPSPAGWGAVIAQLNYQSIYGPPVGIYVHADRVRLGLQSGLCRPGGTPHPPGPGCATSLTWRVIPAPQLGIWHQVLLHVRWAANESGLLQLYHRRRGQAAWERRVNFSGKPTVQWTATVPADPDNRTSDKIGAYRGHSTAPLSVWHDNFCVATSRFAAESCL